MDYQFCLDPTTDAVFTADPVGQWQQPARMIRQPTETTLDIIAAMIQRFSELVLQQCHRTQPSRAVFAMSKTVTRPFSLSHQLMARTQGNIVKRITVIRLVAKDISAPVESRDQAGGNFGFTGVQWRDFPDQRQWGRPIHGVQLVTLGVTPACSTPSTIGVSAVTSDGQRLAVHNGNQAGLSQLGQVLFHNIHQSLDFGRSQSATHRRLRWQFSYWPKAFRPIFGLAGPRGRPFVQRGPQEHHDDFEVKESGRASRVPTGQISDRIGTIPTRVRVPCFISLKKGFNKISMYANSLFFQPFLFQC
jgi:hypothetical protein